MLYLSPDDPNMVRVQLIEDVDSSSQQSRLDCKELFSRANKMFHHLADRDKFNDISMSSNVSLKDARRALTIAIYLCHEIPSITGDDGGSDNAKNVLQLLRTRAVAASNNWPTIRDSMKKEFEKDLNEFFKELPTPKQARKLEKILLNAPPFASLDRAIQAKMKHPLVESLKEAIKNWEELIEPLQSQFNYRESFFSTTTFDGNLKDVTDFLTEFKRKCLNGEHETRLDAYNEFKGR